MGWNTKGQPYGKIAVSQAAEVVSAVPCGVVSVVLSGNGTDTATCTVWDSAVLGAGTQVVVLATKESAIYCPSKPDACHIGCVVTTGANSEVTISIE